MEKLEDVIQEPPGGPNYGTRRASGLPDEGNLGQREALNAHEAAVQDFIAIDNDEDPPPFASGVSIVDSTRGSGGVHSYGAGDMGMTSHRGVLADGEYVDFFALRQQLEEEFGFTYADIALAYKNGRPSAAQLQLRVQIDARVLELSRAGGNMAQFAKAVGVNEKAIDRALVRARLGNPEPTVKRGVVKRDRVCFKCEAPAKRRKRRFSTSPPEWTGTIDLCDEHYAAGFEERPGNPAYWEFREDRRPIVHAR